MVASRRTTSSLAISFSVKNSLPLALRSGDGGSRFVGQQVVLEDG